MSPRARTEKEENAARQRLMESGRERFARYGLKKVSIDELVADARISKGSFYKLFESKEHLFVAIKDCVEEEIFLEFKAALDAVGDDPRALLTEFFLFPQRHIGSKPFVQQVFAPGVMEAVAERVGLEAAGGRDIPHAVIGVWIDEWHAAGVVPESLTTDNLVGLASIFGAAMRSRELFRADYDETIRLAVDSMVKGLLTE